MGKTIARVAVAIAASAGLCVAASPAQADSAQVFAGSCSTGNFCLFENNDFNNGNTNHWRDIVHDDSDFRGNHWRDGNGYLTDDDMNDETSSIKNRAGCTVTLYKDPDYKGDSTPFANGKNDGYLANDNVEDNAATSARFDGC
ncbi:peptidase inhibitor family I36 protein [Nonomuraea sp. K274]|uniref:Peptidase inhibitor family I36 protein n=1 Tax=Nonomuraea cypriaca TaxID=1187855 RepID=A0A931EY06_9ACTN|nr:peptidase inhibitor family I36 protein [Nonomuraea cypriaca]MBF8184746.1 peptidase inhibitor family I36 protein [Nonomuraea cypriaca]